MILGFCIAATVTGVALISVLIYRKARQRSLTAALRLCEANAIDEELYARIGGIEQWIRIRGASRVNPALLIIHGGPGATTSIFIPRIRRWENHFTIVHWDQRGSGKTLRRNGERRTDELNMDRLLRDGIEVAELVCKRLGRRKVILLGSSFGSTFALKMVQMRPDLFSAYVGTDQNVGMARRRDEMHRALVDRLQLAELKKGAAEVERIGSDPQRWSADDYLAVAKWSLKIDRTSQEIMMMLKESIWYSPSHSLADIRDFVRGMRFSREKLVRDAVGFDAWSAGTRFEIPFFIFQGEHDVVTATGLAREYFESVAAPVKEMAQIRNAGHFAAFLRPEQFLEELLNRVRPVLATDDREQAHAS